MNTAATEGIQKGKEYINIAENLASDAHFLVIIKVPQVSFSAALYIKSGGVVGGWGREAEGLV